jgi:hypothetical protein
MVTMVNYLFARLADYGLFYLLLVALSLVLPFDLSDSFYLISAVVTPLIWPLVGGLVLKLWGCTVGHRIVGLRYFKEMSYIEGVKENFRFRFDPKRASLRKISKWRYVLAVIMTLGCGSSLFFGNTISTVATDYESWLPGTGWIQFDSDDGRFTAIFPKEPVAATHVFPIPDSNQSLDLNELKVHKHNATFSVSYLELPRKWRIFSSNMLLKAAMKFIFKHRPGAQIIERQSVQHKNYPAIDFKALEDDNLIEGRIILVGGTLYKLEVIHPKDALHDEKHDLFLDSFELKP